MSWFGTPHFAMQILGARLRVQTHMRATVVAFNDSNRKNKFFIHFVLESPLERSMMASIRDWPGDVTALAVGHC